MPETFGHLRSDKAHAQGEAQSSISFLVLWNRSKLVLQTLGKLAIRLQAVDLKLNVPGTFGHFRSDQAHAQGEAQSSKRFLALWNRSKLVLQTLGKLAIRLQALDRKLNVPGTFGQFRSDQAHAHWEAQSSKSFLALWNWPKLVLQTLGKLAIRLQTLDRKLNVPATFGHFRSDQAHAQGEAQSSKSFLALWNRPKLVLQPLGKLAIRLQTLDRKLNVPGTFGHFRSDQAHAQGEAHTSKSFLAFWNWPKLVLQTLGKLAIRLQALDRKLIVPGTFGHFRSDQAHAQGEAYTSKIFLTLWNRPKLVLQTLGKLAIRLEALDRKINVPGILAHLRSDQAHTQRETQSSKSFLALWKRSKLVLQTLGKLAIRLQALDRKLNVPGTFGHFSSDQAHAQGEAQSSKSFLALWNRPKPVLQPLGKLAIRLQALDRKLNVPGPVGHFRSVQAHAQKEAQRSKCFLALWHRSKLVLRTLGNLAIRLQALDRKLNVPGTFGHFRSDQAHAQREAQSSKSFLALWNRSKLVLQTLGKLAIRLQALDRKLNVPGTFGQFRSDQAHAQGEAHTSKSFLALWNRSKLVLQTLGKLTIRLQALDRKLNVPGTFGQFRSDQAHAQGEAQSSKSVLALWNRSKLVMQTLGKLAIRLQALDRKLNVLETFGHFRSDQAHAQGEAQSSKTFLALWNLSKLVLQALGKLAIRLQALDHKLNVPGTFGHFRSDQAHAQGEAQCSKRFLALWNRPKLVMQTLDNLAIPLQALDRKLNVPGTFGHFRSDQAHAQREAQSSKSFLALWNRSKLVLQTLGKLAIRLQALDRKLNVPGTFGQFRSDQAHAQGEAHTSKSFLALWNRSKLVLQTLGKLAIRLQALDRKLNVPGTFGQFRSDQAHAQGEAKSSKTFLALWNRSKLVLQTLGNLAICFQALDRKLNVPGTFGHLRSDQAHAQGEAQSSKSFLALWNRSKQVLQTLGELAIRLQA